MLIPGQFLTQDCLLCAEPGEGGILCLACAKDLPHLPKPCCLRCALPIPHGEICGRCLNKPPHFDTAFVPFVYDFPLDKLVQSFKYGHRLAIADYLGKMLVKAAGKIEADTIIPLPLHPERLRERGFNQALELARPLSRALKVPIDSRSCKRIRHTPAQADLPWQERAKNIRGAFQCTIDLSGQRILLVDDVMTTGTTLDECSRTLKQRGAATVTVLAVARVLPKSA